MNIFLNGLIYNKLEKFSNYKGSLDVINRLVECLNWDFKNI